MDKLFSNMLNYLGDDYLIGDPEGEPIVVRISGNNWIPVSVLIYAKSEELAADAILNAYKYSAYKEEGKRYENHVIRAKKILDGIKNGELKIQTSKLDKRYLVSVPWACNDYI
jgi:hypothetical protein